MHIIQSLINEARAQQWPYPKLFELLKNVGVVFYTIDFTTKGYSAVYKTSTQELSEIAPEGYQQVPANSIFDETKIKAAIMDNAFKKIIYVEFLSRIAQAGVASYDVDMEKRLVTYYNQDKSLFYQQNVPFFHEAQ